jgi:hypothetical protein
MTEIALFGQLLLWGFVLAVFLASGQASIFHPATVYLGFHGLVFVLRPMLVHYLNFDSCWAYMLFTPTESIFDKTLLVSSVGLVVFVGFCLGVGRTPVGFSAFAGPAGELSQTRGLVPATLLLLPLIAWSIYDTRGGVQGARVGGVYILTQSTGYLTEAQNLLMPLLCAWLVKTRFHWINALAIGLYLGYRVWFGQSRWTILLFVLMVGVSYSWQKRNKWLPIWSLLMALPAMVIFNTLGHNRDFLKGFLEQGQWQSVDYRPGTSLDQAIRRWLDTQDFANFDFLAYIVGMVPERSGGYTFTAQYLQLFTEPIPRMLWKGKPVGAPVKQVDLGKYGNFNGLTWSLNGDGWISGGWVGLLVVMASAGSLLGLAHRWFWRSCQNRLHALVYIAGLAMLPQYYRDGSPISLAKFLLFSSGPILLWISVGWLLNRRQTCLYSIKVPADTLLRMKRRALS